MLDVKQLQNQAIMCRMTANSAMTLCKLYQAQGDRLESVKQWAKIGKDALIKAIELEAIVQDIIEERTLILAA